MIDYSNEYMLTTVDNPYNPFTDFENWYKEDMLLGHDCCGLLAIETNASDVASEEVNRRDTIDAMDRIVSRWPLIYKKVSKDSYQDGVPDPVE